jgi:hypothetical protein
MVAGFTVDTSVWVMGFSLAMISMTGGALDQGSAVGRGSNPIMTSDTGNPSMDGFPIFLLIHIERDRFAIDLLFYILFPMAFLTK